MNPSKMFFLKITAIALCVASLQSLAGYAAPNYRDQYRDDLETSATGGEFFAQSRKDAVRAIILGDVYPKAEAAVKILNRAWVKNEEVKKMIESLEFLKGYLVRQRPKDCDSGVQDQILSIVGMSDKYFEGKSSRDRLMRMLIFKMNDEFTSRCVRRLRSDFDRFQNNHVEQLDLLRDFRVFLKDETPESSNPELQPIMDKLSLVSNGDRAWHQFMEMAQAQLAAKDNELYSKTWTMPKKEAMVVSFEFVANNSCVLLSQNQRFVQFVHEVSSLSNKFRFEFVDGDTSEHYFKNLEEYAAMYKICMKLKESDAKKLMERVELHIRDIE